jgi:hypothetical protein
MGVFGCFLGAIQREQHSITYVGIPNINFHSNLLQKKHEREHIAMSITDVFSS